MSEEEFGEEFEEPQTEDDPAADSSTEDEEEIQEEEVKEKKPPSLVINVQSWATPFVGLLMLLVGLLAGYVIRPLLPSPAAAETPVAAAPASPEQAVSATQPPVDLQEVMEILVSQARHFRGDPNAPVTLIEFSDFQ